MTSLDKYDGIIKEIKRNKISHQAENATSVTYNTDDIQKIIPHRVPFLLIDSITKLGLKDQFIEVKRKIDPDDPVFKGHFPGQPVYPGVLQVEMMGQASLCLAYFIENNTVAISEDRTSVKGLFTRIRNAGFIDSVLPGDSVEVLAKMIAIDEFGGVSAAQLIKDDKIISHSILEVYFP